MAITLSVNGASQTVDVDPDTPLLWVLRDHLGLTGTKFGCGTALCGACTVHVDGEAVRSCVMPVSSLGEGKVTTIEALGAERLHRLQQAWIDLQVPQCGYCQPGFLMAAAALLAQTPEADPRPRSRLPSRIFAAAAPTPVSSVQSWRSRDNPSGRFANAIGATRRCRVNFAAYIRNQYADYGRIISEMNIKAEAD